MNNLKAHIAVSLDGYIAYKDGDISWVQGNVYREISKNHNSADILLVGSATYENLFEIYGYWPYDQKTYVFSQVDTGLNLNDNIQYITKNSMKKVEYLKKQHKETLSVIGGGKLINSLINHNLIDELHIYIVPILLGNGIRFFSETFNPETELSNYASENSVVKAVYKLGNS